MNETLTRTTEVRLKIGQRQIRHLFGEEEVEAIHVALAARRPLLVRGEPGIGKSQLARAASVALERRFKSIVLNARTEPEDLLWEFDSVGRLAKAQASAHGLEPDALSESNFIRPGVLWWAFDWSGAWKQTQEYLRHASSKSLKAETRDVGAGVVLLIDEIDKADTSVPNGLLEALGNQEFQVPWLADPVRMSAQAAPLILITTNEERSLPDAFMRRCVVLHMRWRQDESEDVPDWLLKRGEAHVGQKVSKKVMIRAARMLLEDRARAESMTGVCPPGQAEYLDLLHAIAELEKSKTKQMALVERLAKYTFQKHQELQR